MKIANMMNDHEKSCTRNDAITDNDPKVLHDDDDLESDTTKQDDSETENTSLPKSSPPPCCKSSGSPVLILAVIALFIIVCLATYIGVTHNSSSNNNKSIEPAQPQPSRSFSAPPPADDCYDLHPQLESMTAREWWTSDGYAHGNAETSESSRYEWFRARQPMAPIYGDTTMIAGVLFTLSQGTLKLTVLFPPLYPNESRSALVLVRDSVNATLVASAACLIAESTWHCPVRASGLNANRDYTYEIVYPPDVSGAIKTTYTYSGNIPKQVTYPKIATLSCFGIDDTKNKSQLVQAVLESKPNLVALQGDQTYMSALGYGFTELVYSMSEVTRNLPTLVQMDDHDYGQGNLFGAVDNYNETTISEHGVDGFGRPTCMVNALQKLAMSHMPDPASNVSAAGIDAYFTSFTYGSVEFAVLESRKFKSHNEENGGSLLGYDQEAWLEQWCSSNNASTTSSPLLKIILTQTPFASLATNLTAPWLEGAIGAIRLGDTRDSNAFPAQGRRRFMEIAHGCSQLIISGDQHVGLVASYDDYGMSECASPAAINDQFWRMNFEPVNTTIVDVFYNQSHTLLGSWNAEEWVWRNYRPFDTRAANDTIKAGRGDGFLMVNLDGQTATCEMHGYRLGHETIWAVTVPAVANVSVV
ncbi:hypothetical protein MPSEU_000552900 [Mayamaea pseudoterrestris]|nr:hypothetical protein MPSEU_000552900 [Mayamaea pseudoterrestris]